VNFLPDFGKTRQYEISENLSNESRIFFMRMDGRTGLTASSRFSPLCNRAWKGTDVITHS